MKQPAIKPLVSLETVTKFSTGICAGLGLTIIIGIVCLTLLKGLGRLNLDFLLDTTVSGAGEGGIGYQIVGTLILVFTAVAIVTPLSTAIAIVHNTTPSLRLKGMMTATLQVMNASPSILFGILGFAFFIKMCGWEKTWFSGGVVLAMMILPTVTISLTQRMSTIPEGYIETAQSLGLNPDQLLKSVTLPYSLGGLLTGIVMGISRAAGETAPIMFVAVVFSGAGIPNSLTDSPVLALPYHIFNLVQDVFGEHAMSTAWASAFVLITFVFMCSLLMVPFRSRSHEEAKQ